MIGIGVGFGFGVGFGGGRVGFGLRGCRLESGQNLTLGCQGRLGSSGFGVGWLKVVEV